MADDRPWYRLLVTPEDGTVRSWEGPRSATGPDMGAIDVLARVVLEMRRRGWQVCMVDVAPEMCELVELAGLPVEVRRQAEEREEALGVEGVEEEAHGRDPVASDLQHLDGPGRVASGGIAPVLPEGG